MAKSKQMFEQMREAELNEHLDDEYQFNKWMREIHQVKNTNPKDSVEVMNELFRSFGEIFGLNQIKNENEREHIQ